MIEPGSSLTLSDLLILPYETLQIDIEDITY